MSAPDHSLRAVFERHFGASSDQVEQILPHLKRIELDGGQWLCHKGEVGGPIFFLTRGRLEVWSATPDEDDKATILGEITAGHSVGEVSFLTGAPRTASVRAIRHSELFSVEKDQFEALARIHPVLLMKLAGRVAVMLRDRTSRVTAPGKTFRTISIVPLASGERAQDFVRRFRKDLAGFGRTLALSPDDLAKHGAPVASLGAGEKVSPELSDWLHDQESRHRYVIYDCSAVATPWSIYSIQQSDIVLFVADTKDAPEPAAGEAELAAAIASSNARRMLVLLQPEPSVRITGTAAWLAQRKIDMHLHVRAGEDDEITRVARVVSGNALGLVLGAGAARGIAHMGVYKALWEAGLRPDWVGGTSIGAIVGAVIANSWGPDVAIPGPGAGFARGNAFGDFTIPVVSLLRGRRLEALLRKFLDGTIEDLPVPFFAVSCNLDSGALNLHESGDLPDALRASASMPGVMPPAVVHEQLAIDGSVLDSMPVDIMQTKPVGRIIAVDLSSQKSYKVSFRTMPSPWAVLRGRLLPFTRKYRVPNLMTLLLKATEVGTLARVRELGSQADLLLTPPVREFGMMDLKSYDRIVDAGYQYTKTALAEWQARLAAQQQEKSR